MALHAACHVPFHSRPRLLRSAGRMGPCSVAVPQSRVYAFLHPTTHTRQCLQTRCAACYAPQPAVCCLGANSVVSCCLPAVVFWGAPLMALHEAIRSRATSVRVRCLSPATHEQIERMGGSCAICWGGMTATAGAGAAASSSAATAAAPAAERPAVLAATTGPERAAASAGAAVASRSTDAATARADGGATTASAPAVAKQLVPDRVRNGSLAVGLERTGSGVEAAADREAEHSGSEGSEMSDEGEGDNSEDSSEEGEESETGEGFALPCGHAYHAPCLAQWLHQCATQGQAPKCPMCSTVIELEVRWRLPLPWNVRGAADALGLDAAGHGGHGHMHAIGAHAAHHHARADVDLIEAAAQLAGANPALRVVGLLEHQRELQALLADMPMWVPPPGPAAQQGALALPLVIEAGAGAPNGAVGGNGGALLGAGERERERGDVDGGRAPRVRIGRQAAAAAVVAPLLRQAAPAAAAAEPAAGPARPVPAPHQQLQGGQQQQGVVAQLLQQVQQQQQVQAQQQQQVQQQLAATQERLAHMRQVRSDQVCMAVHCACM